MSGSSSAPVGHRQPLLHHPRVEVFGAAAQRTHAHHAPVLVSVLLRLGRGRLGRFGGEASRGRERKVDGLLGKSTCARQCRPGYPRACSHCTSCLPILDSSACLDVSPAAPGRAGGRAVGRRGSCSVEVTGRQALPLPVPCKRLHVCCQTRHWPLHCTGAHRTGTRRPCPPGCSSAWSPGRRCQTDARGCR